MATKNPDCAVPAGMEVYIAPGSEHCLMALAKEHIIDVPSRRNRLYLPRPIPTGAEEIKAKFSGLSNACLRYRVLAQAFPEVVKVLSS